jgi:peptide/nickel transport system ATP-binding protein
MSASDIILEVRGLKKHFPVTGKNQRNLMVKAIDGIDFEVRAGETLAIVGESGSGKSTAAYTVIGLYCATAGSIRYKGRDISGDAYKRLPEVRKEIQMVFQDPGTSLNPQRSARQILSLPLAIHGLTEKTDAGRERQLLELLEAVELPPEYLNKYPSSLGGGEKQMLAIARAISTNPSLIVLDEATSSLDVSVQAKIINMLLRIQKTKNLSYLFITHDLSLVRNLATRVAIMYLGKIAEIAPAALFFQKPLHPYTQMLLSAIPVVNAEEEKLKPASIYSQGEIPSPVDVPPGCSFNTRCPFAKARCFADDPIMREADHDHFIRCHFAMET